MGCLGKQGSSGEVPFDSPGDEQGIEPSHTATGDAAHPEA